MRITLIQKLMAAVVVVATGFALFATTFSTAFLSLDTLSQGTYRTSVFEASPTGPSQRMSPDDPNSDGDRQGIDGGAALARASPSGLPLQAPASETPFPATAAPSRVPYPSPVHRQLVGEEWEPHETVVVVAHDLANPEESVTWLKRQPYPYIIMQQGQRGAVREAKTERPNSVRSDHGGPAASYMQFILEHYDNLPAVMIFTAAVETYSALASLAANTVRALDPHAYGFFKVVNYWHGLDSTEEARRTHGDLLAIFSATGLHTHLGMPPDSAKDIFTSCCGGAMVVARDRVLSRPKEVYQLLFDILYTWREKGQLLGGLATVESALMLRIPYALEFQWHFLWGQPWRETPARAELVFPCTWPWEKERKCRSPSPSPSASPSVFLPEQGPGPWQPEPTSAHPNPGNETVVIIARNRLKDSLHWLNEQPYRYVVMEKGLPEGTPNNLPEDRGLDSASYVQFILEHWDNMPARMIFLHGHQHSYHCWDYVDLLRGLDVYRYQYVGVAWVWINSLPDASRNHEAEGISPPPEYIRAVFKNTDLHKYLDMPPEDRFAYRTNCCSNFLVTRERIRARPKELYEHIFYLTYTQNPPIPRINWLLEVIWGHILGQPWLDTQPDLSEMFPHFPPWDKFDERNF